MERILGAGNFGITYLAIHQVLNTAVAIKEYFPRDYCERNDWSVRPNTLGRKPRSSGQSTYFTWGLARFISEGRTLGKIQHPNVVRVVDFVTANDTAYLCMEYEQGATLEEILQRRPKLSERQARALIDQVLSGLEAIHQHRIIHRDIKPSNLYWRKRDRQFMLIDFGSARELPEATTALTHVITHGYAPLEQYGQSSRDFGPWTDIYALGAVLYHAISAKNPAPAPLRVYNDELVPAVEIGRGEYSHALLTAIDRALKLNWQERFLSAGEMRAVLAASSGDGADGAATWGSSSNALEANASPVPGQGSPPSRPWDVASPGSRGSLPASPPSGFPPSQPGGETALKRPPLPGVEQIHGWPTPKVVERQRQTALALGRVECQFRDPLKSGGLGPEMSLIPAGAFVMGSPPDEAGHFADEVQHNVTLPKPFALGVTAVTFDEYDLYCRHTGADRPDDDGYGRGLMPVINVSYEQALGYARWLSQQSGERYRLPTEAEWEYACRAGTTTAYWWGNDIAVSRARYGQGKSSGRPMPVDRYVPNPWGLYQMHGNVWEWVEDVYRPDIGLGVGQINPRYLDGGFDRVIRGGAWSYDHQTLRSAARSSLLADQRSNAVGFRVAKTLRF
ncbi:MAG: SUMF1/EgtB/PvdO family nonheme iron enzyme [Candidatus Competibacterales bacterium]